MFFPLNTMTQAQIDLQTQLEQATPTDLITRPFSNDSPVLYIETSEQTPPTFLEQMEHTKVEHENSKPAPSQKTEHKKSHSSPIKNAPDKLSSLLNNRTLRDMTNLLEPYKRNSSETPITTFTHILHCYDRTHKLLQTLDLDSQPTHHSIIPSNSICFGNYNYSF